MITILAVLHLITGVMNVLAPTQSWAMYALSPDAVGVLATRTSGGAFIFACMVEWAARSGSAQIQRSVLLANAVGASIGAAGIAWAIFDGTIKSGGGLGLGLTVLFAALSAYFGLAQEKSGASGASRAS